jgi:phospholipid/cholesterol/gamma-HCH transport system substrate-binding protein
MMGLSRNMIRILIAAVVLALVAVVSVYVFTGSSNKKVSANFASGVGVYPGTPVKVLGIQVGSVTKVTPVGGSVLVQMSYESKYNLPQSVGAYLVANSLVADRYVQLAPVYSGGPMLASGSNIPLQRTASPAELDDIYNALNQLSTSLGPTGANKNGALSTLINVGASNLSGNGAALGNSIKNLSAAITTLSNGRGDLFGTITNLRKFADALNNSDSQVRQFNSLLATVSGQLADERADLGAALHNLATALDEVANFVNQNASKTHADIVGLESLTGVLVKDKASLNEALVAAPIALANLTHGYQEQTGTLGTRSNLAGLTDPSLLPGQLCDLFTALNGGTGLLSGLLGHLLGDTLTAFFNVCTTEIGLGKSTGTSSTNNLSGLTNNLPALPVTSGTGK